MVCQSTETLISMTPSVPGIPAIAPRKKRQPPNIASQIKNQIVLMIQRREQQAPIEIGEMHRLWRIVDDAPGQIPEPFAGAK